ncbi:FKBP-type peptidyl-prolyl cis-trans isomerase [Sediminibacterium goheungense]|nr:FKBP-type peptidyl-prolyl cis-trans isomerase [Sediminibacterium goheungense]
MKKILFTLLLGAFIMGSVSAQTKTAAQIAKEKATEDSLQYALGVYMLKTLEKKGVLIKGAMFQKAIDDVITKKKLMISEANAEKMINVLDADVAGVKGKMMEQQLFAELAKRKDVITMPSGVRYAVITRGTGTTPEPEDSVVINVTGTTPDGTVFVNSQDKQESFLLTVGQLVPGLQDAVLRMKAGSIWRVFVPANLGFGERGNGTTVPPNTPLVYDIALVSVRAAKK